MLQNRKPEDRVDALEREIAQLREALARRQQYGVVTGMLAVRYEVTPETAWQVLVRVSQHTNLKMVVVARVIYDGQFGRLAPEDRPAYEQVLRHLGGGELKHTASTL